MTAKNHEQRLLEINTLEWDELLAPDNPNKLIATQEGIVYSCKIGACSL